MRLAKWLSSCSARALIASGDPYWSSVVALLPMDGTNGSTTFTDIKGGTWTPTSATISTTQSKFGGASAYFGASSQAKIVGPAFPYGSSNWTVEFFYYYTGVEPSSATFFDMTAISGGTDTVQFNSAEVIGVYLKPGGTQMSFASSPLGWTHNSWHHVAVTRNGSTVTLWCDGVSAGTMTVSGSLATSNAFWINNQNFGTTHYSTMSYIDEFRVTVGVCRYTTTFSPPTAPFPTHG